MQAMDGLQFIAKERLSWFIMKMQWCLNQKLRNTDCVKHSMNKKAGVRMQNRYKQEQMIDIIINNLITNNFTNQELEQYLESSSVLVKANAIIAVFRNRITENNIIQKLNFISLNMKNEPEVLGVWTTGHCAMAVLYLLNTDITLAIYNDNRKHFDEYTNKDIESAIEQIKQERIVYDRI